jgi:hypothetical protein
MDVEILTATAQALLEKMREDKASPMRTAMNLWRAEAKAAAANLGFDTSRKDWMKLVKEESDSYPPTAEGLGERFWRKIPGRVRTRIRALELIGCFTDLAASLEYHVQECDRWSAELQTVLAADPEPMPSTTLIKQLGNEVA